MHREGDEVQRGGRLRRRNGREALQRSVPLTLLPSRSGERALFPWRDTLQYFLPQRPV